MPRRSTSLNNTTGTAITREIDSKYDNVKIVADNIADIDAIVAAINDGSFGDATAVINMVVATGAEGSSATWDGTTLTIPKGDTGDDLTLVGIVNNGNGTMTLTFSDGTVHTTEDLTGDTGAQGIQGDTGVQGNAGSAGIPGTNGYTPTIVFSYNETTGDLEYTITYDYDSGNPLTDEEW